MIELRKQKVPRMVSNYFIKSCKMFQWLRSLYCYSMPCYIMDSDRHADLFFREIVRTHGIFTTIILDRVVK